MKKLTLLLIALLPACLWAQGSGLPIGGTNQWTVDRLEIKTDVFSGMHPSLKGWERGEVVKFAKKTEAVADSLGLTALDRLDLQRIYLDNNEWVAAPTDPITLGDSRQGVYQLVGEDSLGGIYRKMGNSQIEACTRDPRYAYCANPIWGVFFQTPGNWLELNKPGLHLRINPLVHLQMAKPNSGPFLFLNQRGAEMRGGFDDRVFFYTNITDTQGRFPHYVNDYVGLYKALPGNGFYKPYQTSVFDSKNSLDYLNGQAHIGFHVTKSIGLQFGHGKHFIGNGYRSMLLSDFSHNFLYLKSNWRVWRLHYQNLFAEIPATSSAANPGDKSLPRKYLAAHYLGFSFTENFSVGLFEATVFKRDRFELQYLNPVILYRTVEHLLDSEDNILIGLDGRWDLFKRLRLYGQLMMDEYKLGELTGGNGWWGNKFGIQAGALYVDALGIDHLDLRAEFNAARPYTYTHRDSLPASYSNYNQALAHPLGANFREAMLIFRYQPAKKWLLEARAIRAEFGEDSNGQNWGGNILLDYTNYVQEYGNKIGQGVASTTTLLALDLSYEIWQNVSFDLHLFHRKKDSALPERSGTDRFVGLGFRWNTQPLRFDF